MPYDKTHLEGLIETAVRLVLEMVREETPRVTYHACFGMFDLAPQNLSVWYLFDTQEQARQAHANGLVDRLVDLTLTTLRRVGYPPEAFEPTPFPAGGGQTQLRQVSVHVSSDEAVARQDNGDYWNFI